MKMLGTDLTIKRKIKAKRTFKLLFQFQRNKSQKISQMIITASELKYRISKNQRQTKTKKISIKNLSNQKVQLNQENHSRSESKYKHKFLEKQNQNKQTIWLKIYLGCYLIIYVAIKTIQQKSDILSRFIIVNY